MILWNSSNIKIHKKNDLDLAINEIKNGDFETFHSFDELKKNNATIKKSQVKK